MKTLVVTIWCEVNQKLQTQKNVNYHKAISAIRRIISPVAHSRYHYTKHCWPSQTELKRRQLSLSMIKKKWLNRFILDHYTDTWDACRLAIHQGIIKQIVNGPGPQLFTGCPLNKNNWYVIGCQAWNFTMCENISQHSHMTCMFIYGRCTLVIANFACREITTEAWHPHYDSNRLMSEEKYWNAN